ncbi:MAG: DegV family EDD domain-containing protein [Christensenellaceae bacterium]|nr:DegV family EDD domain-containing protein [Christensenellaceae bacterium]
MTDTNSGISVSEGKANGIFVLPMPIIVEGTCYTEGVDITNSELYAALEEGKAVYTSQPAPGEVTELWDRILADHAEEVVYIPMSSSLSSSCDTAKKLALEYGGKVHVVDNRRISVTQRTSVYDALHLSRQGIDGVSIKALLEKSAFDASIYICVDTLKFLKKSGRVTAAAASLATALNLHPILNIRGGKLDAQCVVRGDKRVQKTLINLMKVDLEERFRFIYHGEVVLYTAGTFLKEEQAQEWNARVQKAFPNYQVTYSELSCSIACHVGYNTKAIAMAIKNR